MRGVADRPYKISIYSYESARVSPPPRKWALSARASRVVRSTIVACLCFVAHAILYTSATWTAGAPSNAAKDFPARISVASTSDPDAMQWVVLDANAITEPSQLKTELPAPNLQKQDLAKLLADFALLVPDIDLPPAPDATVADAGRLSKMYGRYVGQVTARIDRAWLRPRTAIGATDFSCQVRITQDGAGNVLELMLEQCKGNTRWQLSLVQAIQSASPLPAPPDPDVFSRTLHLAFRGEAYSSQSPPDQYEPEAIARAIRAAEDDRMANDALAHMSEAKASRGIALTISGDHKTVEFQNPAAGNKAATSLRP